MAMAEKRCLRFDGHTEKENLTFDILRQQERLTYCNVNNFRDITNFKKPHYSRQLFQLKIKPIELLAICRVMKVIDYLNQVA